MKADFQRYSVYGNGDEVNCEEDDGGEYVLYKDARNLADILLEERDKLTDEIWELKSRIDRLEVELMMIQS